MGVAKGARRSRRRFVGALEPFTHVRLGFRSRPYGDLCFIESADVVRGPRRLAFDLDRFAYSTYVVDLTDSLVEGREAEPALFDLLEEILALVDASADPPAPAWLRAFEIRLLSLAGLEPRLESCRGCRQPVRALGGTFGFNPRTGSVSCRGCGDAEEGAGANSGLSVSAAALEQILAWREGPIAGNGGPSPNVAGEARVLLQTFVAHHVRRPLKSPALLREIIDG